MRLVSIPSYDRAPADLPNLIGIVIDKVHEKLRIGTNHGVINSLYQQSEVIRLQTSSLSILNVPKNIYSLREIAGMESKFGGQGLKKCKCRRGCIKGCPCKNKKLKCTSHCACIKPCSNVEKPINNQLQTIH